MATTMVPCTRAILTTSRPAVPVTTVGSRRTLKPMLSRNTPGNSCGCGIGLPNCTIAPAEPNCLPQKAIPFASGPGSGAIRMPAFLPFSDPR